MTLWNRIKNGRGGSRSSAPEEQPDPTSWRPSAEFVGRLDVTSPRRPVPAAASEPASRQRIWPFVLAGVAVVVAVVAFLSVSAATAPARVISARDWQVIAKDPEAHDGDRIVLFGEVTQFDTALGADRFRASVDAVQHAYDESAGYDTTAVLSGSRSDLAGVVEGDVFRAEVTVEGTSDYRRMLGGDITVPALTVTEIQVIGSA
jgi:hypothetical protein